MAESYPEPSKSDSPYPPPMSYTPAPGQTSTMAIVSLIAGIVSWVLAPIVAGIVAVITGHMAKREIRDSMGTLSGDGLATAGLILGYANLVIFTLSICAIIGLALMGVTLPLLCLPFSTEINTLVLNWLGV